MSGIYIPGMEMPTTGLYFVSVDSTGGRDKTVVTVERMLGNRDVRQIVGSFELIPVPPHGRLIDADALIDKVIAKYLEHEHMGQLVFAAAEIKQDICDLISDAPTIIPAEEGET